MSNSVNHIEDLINGNHIFRVEDVEGYTRMFRLSNDDIKETIKLLNSLID